MVFSSLVFLCIFLPVVLILHLIIRNQNVRNGLLLAASLIFYAYGEPVYIFLLLGSTLCNYLLARLLSRWHRRIILIGAVILNISLLCVFKYADFLLTSINTVTGLSLPLPEISLPIGISFFTFQALSYVLDVYNGNVKIQKNYGKLLLYISFFPQLIAGPIVRYRDISQEIESRTVDLRQTAFGLRRFIVGLGKKVLIANTMGVTADVVFNHGAENINILAAWIGAVAYLMQIYYDFSGYSDMAIGLGKMFGFHFKENFNYPYSSTTIQEFWHRWHISLSSWMRDYVYIPLGGNRKGKVRTVLNRWIVFLLTGLWHGANWTFVLWGFFHGFFLFIEEIIPQIQKIPKIFLRLYTMLVVVIGFVLFRADTISEAALFIAKMFSGFDFSSVSVSFAMQSLTPHFILMLVAACFGCGAISKLSKWIGSLETKKILTMTERCVQVVTFLLAWLLLVWCMIRLVGGNYNPFIYFRF